MMTQPNKTRGRIFNGCLGIAGIASLIVGVFIAISGIVYGYTEDKEFYQRQEDYHALDDEREAMRERMDSLMNLGTKYEDDGDTINAQRVQDEIAAQEETDEYINLLGVSEPPRGFSMAYLVTIILCIVASPFILIGIALVAKYRKNTRK